MPAAPISGLARIWLEQMGERLTRAQAGRRSGKIQAGAARVCQQARLATLDQSFADPSGTEARAFQAKKRQLIEGVYQAQVAAEFQAVDNHRRIGEADMLWPQIAMSLDDTALTDPIFEHRRVFLDATPHPV